MRLFLLLLFFTATGWSGEEDEDDYASYEDGEECWGYLCEVAYGGLSFTCDAGCGNPEQDPHASDIYFLLTAWLWHPIVPQEYAAANKKYARDELGLASWEEKPYELSDLSGLYNECQSQCGEDLGFITEVATH